MQRLHLPLSAVATLATLVTTACGGGPGGPSTAEATGSTRSAVAAVGERDDNPKAAILPRLPATPTVSASTVPANGDVNPYGIAFVPEGFPRGGLLKEGDLILANFNNSSNLQGTGTTIVRLNANASPSLFFADADAPGFSTALGVLRGGFVVVGFVSSSDGSGQCVADANGTPTNVGQGALLVIDRHGVLVRTLASATFLDGPWDLTIDDRGERAHVFVSNVLSGTVTRVDLKVGEDDVSVESETQIASGYVHRCDPAAFVVGPTGLALDRESDRLYVASAGDNTIFVVSDASDTHADRGTGKAVVTDAVHLHGPLGLARATNGDLISAQGDAVNPDPNQVSEIVEFNDDGQFVSEFSIDPAAGSAFGVTLEERGSHFRFAAVDDGINVADIWTR